MKTQVSLKPDVVYALKSISVVVDFDDLNELTKRKTELVGSDYIIPVFGILSQRNVCPSSSYEQIAKEIDLAMANLNVTRIILLIDSPGGECLGICNLTEKIFVARSQKPIIAHVNSMACSGAYWIASACNKIVLCNETAIVGSIGVFRVHTDFSEMDKQDGIKRTNIFAGKYKCADSSDHPLTADGRNVLQKEVDDYYSIFVRSIAKYRSVGIDKVLTFADGRTFIGSNALSLGMVDEIKNAIILKDQNMDELEMLKQENANLKAELAALKEKLAALEKPQAEDVPPKENIPPEEKIKEDEATVEDVIPPEEEKKDAPVSKAVLAERNRIASINALKVDSKFTSIKTMAINKGWSVMRTSHELLQAGAGLNGRHDIPSAMRNENRYVANNHTEYSKESQAGDALVAYAAQRKAERSKK